MNNNTNHLPKGLKPPEHFSYLLRLWRTDGQWRASLEITETRDRLGFANLEQLFAYLMNLVENNVDTEDRPVNKETDDPQNVEKSCRCTSDSSQ